MTQATPAAGGAVIASIVVCTRNHREWLGECLASIAADGSTCSREVVVVDNASTDGTPTLVADLAGGFPHPLRLVTEESVGLSRARNTGVRASAGDIVMFTDDDVCVADGWADALAAAFEQDVAAAGGRILPQFLAPPPDWMRGAQLEYTTLPDYGTQPFDMRSGRLPVGANMAVRRELLTSRPMPFEERLGHRGGMAIGFEERYLLEILVREHRVVYAPEAVVRHRVREDRLQYARLRQGFYQGGFGLARYERMIGAPMPDLARRAVRTWRTARAARSLRRSVDRADVVTAEQAELDFLTHMWAGKCIEMLVGRFPSVADALARRHP